jgi:hypothetical protein
MAKAVQTGAGDKAEAMHATPFPVLDPGEITATNARNVEYMTRSIRACYGGIAQMNWEIADFASKRLQKDLACAQSYVNAKTSKMAFHAQAEFLEEMLRDYADEASKILHMAADMTNNTMDPVEARAEEVLEELDERGAQRA